MRAIRLAVRQLIEFVMRSGDIDNSYRSAKRMQEGIKAHQKIQSEYGSRYQKEVRFQDNTELEDVTFQVEGRADGVLEQEGRVLIDEIKSTTRSLADLDPEANQLHWAQAKCYAHFYCKQHQCERIDVQLTYVNLEEEPYVKKHCRTLRADELAGFYTDLLRRHLEFSKAILDWQNKRDESLETLRFPYKNYRPGQRKMAVAVYRTIEDSGRLFVDAPTGIGKTVSAMVPAISAIPAFGIKKIFYLTARTTTQREPGKALKLLEENGLLLKSVQLSAKERMCSNDSLSCNPQDCPAARGHFDRVNEAILDLFRHEHRLTKEVLFAYAQKHRVCPFELQLDMSDYSDFVLCDYNYVFDPRVYLRRAFDEEYEEVVLLVDEAHNLIDRGREMFSCELRRSEFEQMKDCFPAKRFKTVRRHLQKAIAVMNDFHLACGGGAHVSTEENPDTLYEEARALLSALDAYLSSEKKDVHYEAVREFGFHLLQYTRIFELWQEGFRNFLIHEQRSGGKADLTWRIQCIDTSRLLAQLLGRVRASVFFSATLTPMSFYTELLGGGAEAKSLHLESPFDRENLLLLSTDNLSTRYADRSRTLSRLIESIHLFVTAHAGNYMVFFPSYQYLEMAADAYRERYGESVLVQQRDSDDAARRDMLKRYEEEEDVVGFFVLGGLFAEGIDLVGEHLIGCAIVSVGMPGLSFERDVIRDYFDRKEQRGFAYAYTFPGFNKILQAAGRVIRSATDRGVVLLLDDRFSQPAYRRLFPRHWQHMRTLRTSEELADALQAFWQSEDTSV
ncbi:MAG: ATP-dependent DNA helicase [Ndongobacter sp.]|nr:ATP-dependent DNA helicase [Ndongobacter sp.]